MRHYYSRAVHPDDIIEGIFEDVFDAGTDIVDDFVESGEKIITDRSGQAAEEIINSTAFKQALQMVRQEAEAGAMQAVKKNAVPLVGITIAAGAVGGMLFKGWTGAFLAAGLAGVSGIVLMQNMKPPPAKKKR